MRVLVSDWNDLDAALPLALAYGVGIEVLEYSDPNRIDSAAAAAKEMAARLEPVTLRALHGPFAELSPASKDRLIRQATRTRFLSAHELAVTLGARHLVFHTGYIPRTYPREKWLANAARFWVSLLGELGGGVSVHLENVFEDDHTTIAELLDTVNAELEREALSACLDIGHVHAYSSRPLEEWIAGLGGRIRYVHLHNNDGLQDDHYRFSRGGIDIARVLELLLRHAPDALWTVEMAAAEAEDSLLWLREKGYL